MKSRPQRLKAIELTLTPKQVVAVWLRSAIQAGTFEDVARRTPPHREAVANAVLNAVRNGMKGQDQSLIERAVLQARQEADFLYNLVVNVNLEVIVNGEQREREYILLFGYMTAEMRGKAPKNRVQNLRFAVLMFLESVIILDAAIAQVAVECLNGQPVLFHDRSVTLENQLRMVQKVSEHFNLLARTVDTAEINLEELRNSLRSETDRRVSVWEIQARLEMLSTFGTEEKMHSVMHRYSLLFGPGEGQQCC